MKNGWESKSLSEVSAINYGYTESANSDPVGPRFLRITDIQDDGVDWESVPYCKIEPSDLSKYRLASGDIVFARTGATTGKSFLVDDPPDAVFASYLIRPYPFFTCSREIFAIDEYAFDCEAILLAGNNAVGDFNVKHYKGKFNAYQRTYVITVNEKRRVLYRFLYFQILKSLKKFKSQSVGAGTKFLKLGMIKEMEIALPSLAEQQRIV